jgi:hypothetical protein
LYIKSLLFHSNFTARLKQTDPTTKYQTTASKTKRQPKPPPTRPYSLLQLKPNIELLSLLISLGLGATAVIANPIANPVPVPIWEFNANAAVWGGGDGTVALAEIRRYVNLSSDC